MSILSVFAVLGLAVLLGMVMNVGRQVDGKIRLQNAADAAAYSGGGVLAREMNTLAFTNHLMCEVFAMTAYMREARQRNAESHVPAILDAWAEEGPVFGQAEFPKFQALAPAIAREVPLERTLVASYGDWAYVVSETVLPLMEAILAQELIPQYQRAVVEAFPEIAQAAAMEVALRNGRPDHGRGPLRGALWTGAGTLGGTADEATDPTLPVVDPERGIAADLAQYQATARSQREVLANHYLALWNNWTLTFFDQYAKMSRFNDLWRSYTCGHLRQLLEVEYPDRNLPFVIRDQEGMAANNYLDRYFSVIAVAYWRPVPPLAPKVFVNPMEGTPIAYAQARVFVPTARLVWQYVSTGGGGGGGPPSLGGVPGQGVTLPTTGATPPGGGGGPSVGYWVVGRQAERTDVRWKDGSWLKNTDWTLWNQRWSCQLVPATMDSLPEILRTTPALPAFAGGDIAPPSLGNISMREIEEISPH